MNKKIKIILLIIILILLVLIIKSTYSKYTAEAEATIERYVAGWVIKVNDTDITVKDENATDDSVTFNITGSDVVWEENGHTTEGKVSPGMKGYFYLRIDPQNTQTAIKYTININVVNVTDEHIDFRINAISEVNGKEIKVKSAGKNSILQRIKLLDEIKNDDEKERIDTIKVEVEWVDNPLYNDFDTQIGETIDKTFLLPVTVNAIQYTGEGYDF